MKRISYILSVLSVLLASCNKVADVDSNEIVIKASVDGTKVSSGGFVSGDDFSLWAVERTSETPGSLMIGGNFLNGEHIIYDGSHWKGARPVYWSDKACDFYALYPYQEGGLTSVSSHPFSVLENQNISDPASGRSNYDLSDCLYARAENVSRSESGLSLHFTHILSRCAVELIKGENFEGEIPDDVEVHIYNTVVDGLVDMSKGSVAKDPKGSRKLIAMRKQDNSHFDAVVIPQHIETRTPLIEVTMGGISYLLECSLSFRPGHSHKISLTVNTSPDQEQIEIAIDPSNPGW